MVPTISLAAAVITFLLLSIPILTVRLLAILPSHRPPPRPRVRGSPACLLIVLGSGGHTAEMLAMLAKINLHDYTHRIWIVSSGDEFSAQKAHKFEAQLLSAPLVQPVNGCTNTADAAANQVHSMGVGAGTSMGTLKGKSEEELSRSSSYAVHTIPRARAIHQSLLSTPFTALSTLRACIPLLLDPAPPDLILTNGPATATILIFASLALRFLNVRRCHSRGKLRTIYVESWARVKRLSLSGRLLCGVVDRFVVQWEGLEGVRGLSGGRGEFRGVLV
ncbi:MAG: UDP-N-acetylglucosamine transferase subunit [Bathelium mastoideum]|nr:MAG: UDP-N-acetylglucosamine transferase subunit [Bathelium mastoideum]